LAYVYLCRAGGHFVLFDRRGGAVSREKISTKTKGEVMTMGDDHPDNCNCFICDKEKTTRIVQIKVSNE